MCEVALSNYNRLRSLVILQDEILKPVSAIGKFRKKLTNIGEIIVFDSRGRFIKRKFLKIVKQKNKLNPKKMKERWIIIIILFPRECVGICKLCVISVIFSDFFTSFHFSSHLSKYDWY